MEGGLGTQSAGPYMGRTGHQINTKIQNGMEIFCMYCSVFGEARSCVTSLVEGKGSVLTHTIPQTHP